MKKLSWTFPVVVGLALAQSLVLFSHAAGEDNPVTFYRRTIPLDTEVFFKILKLDPKEVMRRENRGPLFEFQSRAGQGVLEPGKPEEILTGWRMGLVERALNHYFTNRGIDLSINKAHVNSVFFNPLNGTLLVQGTLDHILRVSSVVQPIAQYENESRSLRPPGEP